MDMGGGQQLAAAAAAGVRMPSRTIGKSKRGGRRECRRRGWMMGRSFASSGIRGRSSFLHASNEGGERRR